MFRGLGWCASPPAVYRAIESTAQRALLRFSNTFAALMIGQVFCVISRVQKIAVAQGVDEEEKWLQALNGNPGSAALRAAGLVAVSKAVPPRDARRCLPLAACR